jgi:hypothetical protein
LYLGLSSLLHVLLIVVVAFTVELLRHSNRELELSKRLYGIYTPLRVSLRTPTYYPARSTSAPGSESVRHAAALHRTSTILLQPTTALGTIAPNKIPAFLYWLPAVPARPSEKTVTPGPDRPARAAIPSSEPGSQTPDTERLATSLSLARAEARLNASVPPSSSLTIGLIEPPRVSGESVSGGAEKGAAITAISVTPPLPSPDELVMVPPVSSLGPGAGGSSAAAGDGQISAGTEISPARQEPVVRFVDTRTGRLEIREFPDGSQEIHYPQDGRFDAVVVQAGAGDLVPAAEELLTGQPVQTVYLAVGTAREWVLQYCVPYDRGGAPAQSGMVVSLGGPARLLAPWIRTVVLPPWRAHSPKPSVFYGKLQANGRLMNMRALSNPRYQDRLELLPYLEQWEFRAAQHDGVAAEIEVLLIIPAEAAL